VCQTTPEPSKTLANILDLLINKVCCLSEIVDDLPTSFNEYKEPTLNYPTLAGCTAFSGLTNDLHRDYTVVLANKICALNTTVNNHTTDIADHEDRIQELESLVPTPLPNLPSCLTGVIEPLDDLVENLENNYCIIKDALGDEGAMATAISRQCLNLSSQKQLINSNQFMINYPGWEPNPENLSESINNLWITVCDIRAAVRSILDNCCKAGCDDIYIEPYIKWSTEDDGILLVNFKAKSNLPLGFYDCGQPTFANGNNIFKLTDSLGMEATLPAILFRHIDYPADTSGVLDDLNLPFGWFEIDMIPTQLDLSSGPIQMTADLCFTDGTIQCIKCVSFVIPAKPANKCCEIKATGDVTIIYKTC
jgi:hypothetical protein